MNFTTTTEIARKWSKIFKIYNEAVVLSNNKPIWAIINYKIYEYFKKSWYFDEEVNQENFSDEDYYIWLQSNLKDWNNDENNNLFA